MNKRFLIKASHLVGGYFVIVDTKGEYTFPVAGDIASNYMFFKALNELHEENEQLKKQLQEEQYRTTPISLTTNISDDDFKKIELMLKKYFGDLE